MNDGTELIESIKKITELTLSISERVEVIIHNQEIQSRQIKAHARKMTFLETELALHLATGNGYHKEDSSN